MARATELLGGLSDHGEDQLSRMDGEPRPGESPEISQFKPDFTPEASSPGPGSEDGPPGSDESWGRLVARLKEGEAAAMAELYQVFAKGIRCYLCRQVGSQELDDRVHDAFLIVVHSIKRGELRDPRRLMGFVRTVVRRMVAAQIDHDIQMRRETTDLDCSDRIPDQRANPEKSVIMRQKVNLIREVLERLNSRDQEILRRFYVEEQHPDQICNEMNLSITQFRLLKSRAKARFGEEGRKKIQAGTTICEDPLRTFG